MTTTNTTQPTAVRNDGYCTEPCAGVGVLHPHHGVGQSPVHQADLPQDGPALTDPYATDLIALGVEYLKAEDTQFQRRRAGIPGAADREAAAAGAAEAVAACLALYLGDLTTDDAEAIIGAHLEA